MNPPQLYPTRLPYPSESDWGAFVTRRAEERSRSPTGEIKRGEGRANAADSHRKCADVTDRVPRLVSSSPSSLIIMPSWRTRLRLRVDERWGVRLGVRLGRFVFNFLTLRGCVFVRTIIVYSTLLWVGVVYTVIAVLVFRCCYCFWGFQCDVGSVNVVAHSSSRANKYM